jgi:hypothetical protein
MVSNPIIMPAEFSQDWEHGEKSSLVSIRTHKLHLSVSGQDCKPSEPIVILMHGLGASLFEWNILQWLINPFA